MNFCEHGDINQNDVGRIVDTIENGYAIEFTKKFKTSPYDSEELIIFGLPEHIVFL